MDTCFWKVAASGVNLGVSEVVMGQETYITSLTSSNGTIAFSMVFCKRKHEQEPQIIIWSIDELLYLKQLMLERGLQT